MSDTAPFDLSSATGRKAVESAAEAVRRTTGDAEAVQSIHRAEAKSVIAAALAVYEDPACPTCEGQGWVPKPWSIADPRGGTQCPSCNGTGQNPEQLVKLSEVVEALRGMRTDGREEDRWLPSSLADFIERWARERPDA